jgi:hypothetical protein
MALQHPAQIPMRKKRLEGRAHIQIKLSLHKYQIEHGLDGI